MDREGVLYICPTPIGNLEDITLRVLRILKEADLIAAEDTRRTVKLLNHYNISTPMTSYHEHNRNQKGDFIIEQLQQGKKVALVSDAGTPGISDPGEELIKKAIQLGIKVESLPGPTAIITALVASGLPTGQFFFQGFLPRDTRERRKCIEGLKGQVGTIVLYVSPHRLIEVLRDCLDILGDREVVIARELTKVHEEFIRGAIGEVMELFKQKGIKGEFVLLIRGKDERQPVEEKPWQHMSIKEHLLWNMEKGLSKKEAIKKTAQERNIPKRQVYSEGIEL